MLAWIDTNDVKILWLRNMLELIDRPYPTLWHDRWLAACSRRTVSSSLAL